MDQNNSRTPTQNALLDHHKLPAKTAHSAKIAVDVSDREALCKYLLPMFQQVAAKLVLRFGRVSSHTARQEMFDLPQAITLAFLEELNQPNGVIARWQPELGPLEAFMRPFATCRGLDHLRKRRRPWNELEHAADRNASGSDTEQRSYRCDYEVQDILRKLCARVVAEPLLGPAAWSLLEQVFFWENDREEVAKILGVRRNTLDVRIKRLRAQLLRLCRELDLPFQMVQEKIPKPCSARS